VTGVPPVRRARTPAAPFTGGAPKFGPAISSAQADEWRLKIYCTTRVIGVICENDPEVADTLIV
jgi:hypothetical protein